MLQILETGKALYVLAVICGFAILTRMITGHLYKRLLKESTNLAVTKHKRLRELRQRAENTYRMNQGLRDSGAWLEHQLNELKFMGLTLSGWSTLSMQGTWLCLLAGAVGAFASYWYHLDTIYIVLYGGGAVMLAMLTMLFDLGAGSRKEQLLSALQDYMENVMCPRMSRNQPMDSLREPLEGERGKVGRRTLFRGAREKRFLAENAEAAGEMQTASVRSARGVVSLADAERGSGELSGGAFSREERSRGECERTGDGRDSFAQDTVRSGRGESERAAGKTAAALSADSVVDGGRNGARQSGRKLGGRAARRAAEAARREAARMEEESARRAAACMEQERPESVRRGAARTESAYRGAPQPESACPESEYMETGRRDSGYMETEQPDTGRAAVHSEAVRTGIARSEAARMDTPRSAAASRSADRQTSEFSPSAPDAPQSAARAASAPNSPQTPPGGFAKFPESRREADYVKHSLEQIAASREKSRSADENWLKELGPEEVQLIGDILKQYLV